MDYASPLLIFDQESTYIDYNLFQLSSPNTNNIQSLLNIDETLLFIPCEEEGKDGIHTPENARLRKISMTTDGNPNEKKKQKVIHRDIERQRRQEMATLYTSLRDLLPYEFLKGKRSISDHIQESANYIKHMENKMKILKNKKEYLKSLVLQSINGVALHLKTLLKSSQQDILSIETCLDGVLEVSINTALTNGLPCSKVFDILIKEGLNILCSTSNKVDDKLIHIIKTKVSEGRSIAPADLHQRLSNLYS